MEHFFWEEWWGMGCPFLSFLGWVVRVGWYSVVELLDDWF